MMAAAMMTPRGGPLRGLPRPFDGFPAENGGLSQ